MAVSERLFVCLVALLGGCSLITSASDHQDGVEADGGIPDAFMEDGGDMQVADDLGPPADDMRMPVDMFAPSDMGIEVCGGVADLNGGSLVAEGREAYDVTDFTIEVWYRPEVGSLSGDHNLFGRWLEYMDTGSYALYINDGRPALAFSCTGTDFRSIDGSEDLVAGDWVHIAGTFNASTGRARLFVNGVPMGNADTGCAAPNPLGTSADLVLGYDDPAGGEPAQGLVDEARLSRTVRYTDRFTPELEFDLDVAGGDTVALYKFEDAMLPATDASSNENDMGAEGAAELTTACRP